ncbi:hypothetical protein CN317_00940 [Bacillus cereus]|nr:hypothetical protein CN317_00940 [Bacillus cereus]
MKFTLLDNGSDSLKQSYSSLERFDNLYQGTDHSLKDAVIFLNHGLEILLKLILKNHSPALMFSDLKSYQKAKEEMKKKNLKNVFEAGLKLHTVPLEEALKRVEFLCDIEIPETLKAAIFHINKIRNELMHYSIDLNEEELEELVNKLKYCYEESVDFLEKHIENLKDRINTARFELTIDEYEEIMQQEYYDQIMQQEMMEREEEYHMEDYYYGIPKKKYNPYAE